MIKCNERVLDRIMIRHADLQSDSQSAHSSQLESLKDDAGKAFISHEKLSGDEMFYLRKPPEELQSDHLMSITDTQS